MYGGVLRVVEPAGYTTRSTPLEEAAGGGGTP